ncbi:GntR family transcriptional regulator [Streptosporangium sp. NPDC020145]|uniref:GntR family transcriptional regulator n=1 Tax=Streptosporangium sp. NPDC020145 TaxID=3154694 RepID=UPI00343ED046
MSAASQYREIASIVRARVQDGTYARGDQLPREEDLAAQLGVNRVTVNRALKVLVAEGLLRVHRGKGTFVRELPPLPRHAAVRHSREHRERGGSRGALATELAELGYDLRSDNTVGPGRPPEHVAEILDVDPEAESVIVRTRHMKVVPSAGSGEVPVQIATSYIPRVIADGTPIAESDSGVGGISSRLEELGHGQREIEERITVRPPSPEESRLLEMADDQRVYDITHIGWTADDRPVKVTTYVMPTHQWDLRYRYPVNPADGA